MISQNNESSTRILDIGCGVNKILGAIGMDNNRRSAADVIHDLDDLPYPFADNQFDVVIGRHVIEHVHDPMAVMSELHRITRPGGLVKLIAPHWTNPDFATDLTHRNYLNSYSFRNLIEGREVFPFYSEVRFRQRRTQVTLLNLWRPFGFEFLINLDNTYPRLRFLRKFWEHYVNAIVRGKEISFELEVVKKNGFNDLMKTKLAKPVHRRDSEQQRFRREKKCDDNTRGKKKRGVREFYQLLLSLLLSAKSPRALSLCGEWALYIETSMLTADHVRL